MIQRGSYQSVYKHQYKLLRENHLYGYYTCSKMSVR